MQKVVSDQFLETAVQQDAHFLFAEVECPVLGFESVEFRLGLDD